MKEAIYLVVGAVLAEISHWLRHRSERKDARADRLEDRSRRYTDFERETLLELSNACAQFERTTVTETQVQLIDDIATLAARVGDASLRQLSAGPGDIMAIQERIGYLLRTPPEERDA